jgi:hypothetical protein
VWLQFQTKEEKVRIAEEKDEAATRIRPRDPTEQIADGDPPHEDLAVPRAMPAAVRGAMPGAVPEGSGEGTGVK